MTISQAGKQLSVELNRIYNEREAVRITNMVMEKITGFTNTERLINKQALLTAAQQDQLQAFEEQLLQHKPVQYVLHEAWFAGLKLYVDENVLIPRPETEELVEAIAVDIGTSPQKALSLIDIGTGSGCIAISLKKKLPDIQVYTMEISDKALEVAQRNATANDADIRFLHADILQRKQHKNFPPFDIIVSNPPYIKETEASEMAANVLLYEPHQALFVPDDDALLFYRAIAEFGLQNLRHGNGKIFVEINETLGEEVSTMFNQKGFSAVKIRKDMQRKERIVSAVLK
ncbi:MAG TPA: peptide chain release factor N(5)-glutamine methyltransferase [Parafilimonas sp.]|nr:peptide chain release factor N(5)-glutamine methyltransferase [Parafilimonas sp.]